MVGGINWLAISARPDLATIVNILSRYIANLSVDHIEAVRHIAHCVKGIKHFGIVFYNDKNHKNIEAFVKFPLKENVMVVTNANWGPQDDCVPEKNSNVSLKLFKSKVISGFLIWHHRLAHWISKHQSITTCLSAESKIYATDIYTLTVQNSAQTMEEMGLHDLQHEQSNNCLQQ
eukprot:3533903-Ditylum_brightwellii.AAC.1